MDPSIRYASSINYIYQLQESDPYDDDDYDDDENDDVDDDDDDDDDDDEDDDVDDVVPAIYLVFVQKTMFV